MLIVLYHTFNILTSILALKCAVLTNYTCFSNSKNFMHSKTGNKAVNQCCTGSYAIFSLSSNFSFPLVAGTASYSGSVCCCWWEDDSALSCDRYLLIQWYSRIPARTPTTNAIVPVTTTAVPTATFIVTPVLMQANTHTINKQTSK